MVCVRFAIGKACDDAARFGDAGIDALDQLVDVAGETIEILVVIGLFDAAAEVAGRGGRDDLRHAGLEIVALGAHHRFFRVHLADGKAVLLEHLDGTGHFADFVGAANEGNGDIEIAFGNALDRSGNTVDRPAEVGCADVETEARAGCNAQAGDGEHQPEDLVAEGFDIGLHVGQFRRISLHDCIDVGLERLAVGTVVFVIALFVGCCRAFVVEKADSFGAEGMEFLCLGHQGSEIILLTIGHHRRPFGNDVLNFDQIVGESVGEALGALGIRGTVDAAALHDDGGNVTVQTLAEIGAA